MSKRHQASRRKAYGRRQHEVRERGERRQRHEEPELAYRVVEHDAAPDELPFFGLGIGVRRLRLALGD